MLERFFSLHDRVAIITGAGIGIGAEIARTFAEAGAICVVSSRREDELIGIGDELRARGAKFLAVVADVREEAAVEMLVQRTIETFGRIDIVVNNAGGSYMFPLVDTPIDKWDNIINLNLRGPFMLVRAAGRHMIESGGGSIVNISSTAGINGVRGGVTYSAAKCGLQMMTRVVAAEWGRYQIRANCVAPGPTASEGALRSWARAGFKPEDMAANIPLRRVGTPQDIALATLFFASDASRHISGETLAVCGGPTMEGLSDA
jgi:citronellol/citronellal dehydrogenase